MNEGERSSHWYSKDTARVCKSASGEGIWDVLVIGGGLTGLSVAFHFKTSAPELRVAVFEAARVGSGASGDSGGILVEHPAAFGSIGDVSFLREFVATHGIECDWRESAGTLVGSEGEYDNDLINPLMLCRQLAKLCNSVGVQVFEESEVTELHECGPAVNGDRFSAKAEYVVVATDAFDCPWLRVSAELVRRSQPCVTVTAPQELAKTIPWTFYKELTDGTYVWGRRLDTRGFLFGGSEVKCGAETGRHSLLQTLCDVLPTLRDAEPGRFWVSSVASFRDGNRRILLSEKAGISFIGGYCGYGIAAAVRAGAVMAASRLHGTGDDEFPSVTID